MATAELFDLERAVGLGQVIAEPRFEPGQVKLLVRPDRDQLGVRGHDQRP